MKKIIRVLLIDNKGKEVELKIHKELMEFANKSGIDSGHLAFDMGKVFGQVNPESTKILDMLLLDHVFLGLYLSTKYKIEIKNISVEEAIALQKRKSDAKSYIG